MGSTLVPLASLTQIQRTPSREDGIPAELEEDLRAYGCKLIQQTGICLQQNQVAMSTAQILFHRFWYVASLKQFSITDIGMGALYLASKLEECPLSLRRLTGACNFVLQSAQYFAPHSPSSSPLPAGQKKRSESLSSQRAARNDAVIVAEMQILKRLGFNVHVVLPYGTLVNYLRVLELTDKDDVSTRAWGYLNDALQTPVYALFQIPTIVCASILLTTRHLRIPLPSKPPNCWWTLFDADWEDIWIVAGYIMRLYRERGEDEQRRLALLFEKKELRMWLEENAEQRDPEADTFGPRSDTR